MKETFVIPAESVEAFERGMGMLDKSIAELRRVALDMMPEGLVRLGLDNGLRAFCDSIDRIGVVRLTYQSFELEEKTISRITALAVYRIVQELVNNILEYAHARAALVRLTRKADRLKITVEDNGEGFDETSHQNLRNAITRLNGTMEIRTSPGKGTSVEIEIAP